ncbi:hypothetical protein [Citreimonas salinaria]|uniref:YMGG-like Gly-zipper n=1 Tax=Citreimonas salinaria TaxID=321339 RepID=A0A1H3JZL6_9RHOB|nr:hypothetical protein [Citreimonas salinaria]SDY45366.1 hypothetical protein SAMN05444340_10880 [Citreimonas salinaria]
MRIVTLSLALASCVGLAACEGSDLERGVLGAGIGAAGAAATNNDVAAGAAIGGAAGVVCDDISPRLCADR